MASFSREACDGVRGEPDERCAAVAPGALTPDRSRAASAVARACCGSGGGGVAGFGCDGFASVFS
jgi:hypothetical protein